jgi:YD repeat-containing protein
MARTAPVPNIPAIPGMNPGVFVLGGGAGGGGSGGPGGGAGSGNQGGGGSNGGDGADGGEKGALDPEKYPLCGTKSHPVDVATGRAFTHPIPILELPGPMPLRIARSYSSTARHEDMGLGWGWAHSLGWRLVVGGRTIDVWTDLGTRARFPKALASGDEVAARFGYRLRREPSGFVVDPSDGRRYVFRDRLGERTWLLSAIEDANGNRVTLRYESGRLVEVIDSAGRVIRVRTDASGRVAAFEAKSAIAQGRWIAFERYDYDASGCLVRAVDADGFASTYEYDDEHRLTADTDRAGLCFHFRYDRESRCVESWGDYPGRVDPSLDDDVPVHLGGTLASEVEGTGPRAKGIHHCLFDYAAPDYTEVLDSTHRGRFAHNRFGLLTESADAGPAPVRASYTADGFLSILEYPDGGFERFERDPRGRVLTLADATGAVTVVRRDAEGRPIEVEDPLAGC